MRRGRRGEKREIRVMKVKSRYVHSTDCTEYMMYNAYYTVHGKVLLYPQCTLYTVYRTTSYTSSKERENSPCVRRPDRKINRFTFGF